MRQQTNIATAAGQTEPQQAALNLVVPFTTPALTRAALKAADEMGTGLGGAIRLIRVQCVPYPMDLNQSPVMIDFLRRQMDSLHAELPVTVEIRLARELGPGLEGALHADSVVILAYRKRPWRTSNERLAVNLQKNGQKVILISEGNHNA